MIMRSYFALQGKQIFQGDWLTVLDWARQNILLDPTPVKLFTARGGERNARVIAEITRDSETSIKDGRTLSLKAFLNGI